ncbi:MAG: peptidoglycan DD-metalloendopeptidase family protein [bacterium]|nr:peptidoglycan DD-metalloendopeptidase family protein [bacterium]
MEQRTRNILAQASWLEVIEEKAHFLGLPVRRDPEIGAAEPQRRKNSARGTIRHMLTAASFIYFWAVEFMARQPRRRVSVDRSLRLAAATGAILAVVILSFGFSWPQPTTERNFRELVHGQPENAPLENTDSWDLQDDMSSDERLAMMPARIPYELHPAVFAQSSLPPMILASAGLPPETWADDDENLTIAKASFALQWTPPEPADFDEPEPEIAEAAPEPPAEGLKYTIESGDNLWTVAEKFGVDHGKLVAYNPKISPRSMQPGDKVYVPGTNDPMIKIVVTQMTFPTDNSVITSGFGLRKHPIGGDYRFHRGVDIRANRGTPVKAVLPGVVTYSGWGGNKGYYVKIKHDNGLETVYAHNSKLRVKRGQHVNQGDLISYSGSTGLATGPHVHFEVWKNGKAVDPMKYLPYKSNRRR